MASETRYSDLKLESATFKRAGRGLGGLSAGWGKGGVHHMVMYQRTSEISLPFSPLYMQMFLTLC